MGCRRAFGRIDGELVTIRRDGGAALRKGRLRGAVVVGGGYHYHSGGYHYAYPAYGSFYVGYPWYAGGVSFSVKVLMPP